MNERGSENMIRTKIGQLWTDSVAYVALLTGAGLSIAGNVANVLRTRGVLVDALDIVLAVAFPALVVLMVEVFVSSRWKGLGWPLQVLRWTGTVAIGGMAMRVSWVHLNELMLSRDQAKDVAIIAPLAIDALAIMATALILAGRGQAPVPDVQVDTAADILAKRQVEVDRLAARTAPLVTTLDTYAGTNGRREGSVPAGQLPQDGDVIHVETDASMWARLEADLAGGQEPNPPAPVSPAPAARVQPDKVPAGAAELIQAWNRADRFQRPRAGDVDALVAAQHSVSPRTARGWRAVVLSS